MRTLRLAHLAALAILLSVIAGGGARAHEIDPAISDISVTAERVTVDIQVSLESMLAGIDLSAGTNTAHAPQAAEYDRLRALPPAEIGALLERAWPTLAEGIVFETGGTRVAPVLTGVAIPEVGNTELPRTSVLSLAADLPEGDAPLRFGWDARFGELVVRQVGGGDDAYTAFLSAGDLSDPLARDAITTESPGSVFASYIVVGFEHIVPLGLDHILFVLGLFFFSLHLRPILFQVTAFTVAHTITLALASLGLVTVPGSVVEPLIAASIVFVGLENLRGRGNVKVRTSLVFAFGLLHGLGFASVLGEFGISASSFIAALLGFNVGVEIAQLALILAALALIWAATRLSARAPLPAEETPVRTLQVTYRAVAMVGSIAISLIGAWWTVERVFL